MTKDNVIISNQMLYFYKNVISLNDIENIEYSFGTVHKIRFYLKSGGRKTFDICGGDVKKKGIERIIEVFNERKSEMDNKC